MGTFLIGLIVFGAMFAAFRHLFLGRRKAKAQGGCSGSCASCPHSRSGGCH